MTWKTHKNSFAVDFPNGWTVSVVWGEGTNSSNGNFGGLVEVGAWRTEQPDMWLDEEMTHGYQNHKEVLDYMEHVRSLNSNNLYKSWSRSKEIESLLDI